MLYGEIGKRVDESDVIQATWLDAVRKLEQFNGSTEGEFFAWLKRILENNLKNVIRDNLAGKRDVRREKDFQSDMDSASLHWWEPVAQGSSPSNRMIKGESALKLAAAIDLLPGSQRTAIELRHLQGMKLSEVCKEMEKSADAVVSLIRRGMLSLKKTLTESDN